MFPKDTSTLFTGNVSYYTFQTRYRQKIFLQRNIDRALKYNEEQHRRRGRVSLPAVVPQLPESPPSPPGDGTACKGTRMKDIANRLKTEICISGLSEPVLKIDLTTLRGKPDDRHNSSYTTPQAYKIL